MRILAAADLHGVPAVYEWLARLTRTGVDTLVLAGDLLASDFPEEQRKTARQMVALLKAGAVPVLYIMGNDDNVALEYEDAALIPIHGRRVEVAGYNFVGYQFTPPFVGDAFVKPDDEIAIDLEDIESLVDEKTVLVTHTRAWGHLDLSFGENAGSRAVAALLERKPALAHIHGHIHHRFGRDGNHFNVACAGVCRAMLIELPSLAHSVVAYRGNLIASGPF
jgi:Icc-related predicted phosphoesterase